MDLKHEPRAKSWVTSRKGLLEAENNVPSTNCLTTFSIKLRMVETNLIIARFNTSSQYNLTTTFMIVDNSHCNMHFYPFPLKLKKFNQIS